MPEVKSYDAKDVTLSLFAFLVDSGFAEGEFVRMEQVSDDFTDQAGTDGEVIRVRTNDSRVILTVTLMQTSSANSKLSAVSTLDKAKPNGAGVGDFLLKDRNGTQLAAGRCWVAKPPDVVYSNQGEARVWTLRGVLAKRFDGGHV